MEANSATKEEPMDDLKKIQFVERMRNEYGMAKIKPEFIDFDHKRKLAEEYLPTKVSDEMKELINESKVIDETSVQDIVSGDTTCDLAQKKSESKKHHFKGRNKKRPVEKRPEACDKLCPSIVQGRICSYGEKCKFTHDVQGYMALKPSDIGERCYAFEKNGACAFGITCRFAKQHITEDFKSIVDKEVQAKAKADVRNYLPKDVQVKLWKKKYDFTKSDKVLKELKRKQIEDDCGLGGGKRGKKRVGDGDSEGRGECGENKKLIRNDVVEESAACDANGTVTAPNELVQCTIAAALNTSPQPNNVLPVNQSCIKELSAKLNVEELIRLRPAECKKINFKDKLYLSPLTTVGNLPFRRVCKGLGAEVTCSEMSVSTNLLRGQAPEWALVKRHSSEDIFGVQLCGSYPDAMTHCAQLLTETVDFDFLDINCGCPIELIFNKGEGCALMNRVSRFEDIVYSLKSILNVPLTVKMRTGISDDRNTAHTLIPMLRDWGVDLVTVHGRSRQQRYTRLADWDYIKYCAEIAKPMPLFGNGDILSFEEVNVHRMHSGVDGVLIARGALIKPWLFTEIHEQRHWDISANERFDILKNFTNYGLEHWGSDTQGVSITRRFLLEWLSFLFRYIPVGILERVPQKINEKPCHYFGRNDLETMLSSPNCSDWIKISEMLLGPVPDGFTFLPKHRANAYI